MGEGWQGRDLFPLPLLPLPPPPPPPCSGLRPKLPPDRERLISNLMFATQKSFGAACGAEIAFYVHVCVHQTYTHTHTHTDAYTRKAGFEKSFRPSPKADNDRIILILANCRSISRLSANQRIITDIPNEYYTRASSGRPGRTWRTIGGELRPLPPFTRRSTEGGINAELCGPTAIRLLLSEMRSDHAVLARLSVPPYAYTSDGNAEKEKRREKGRAVNNAAFDITLEFIAASKFIATRGRNPWQIGFPRKRTRLLRTRASFRRQVARPRSQALRASRVKYGTTGTTGV